jgi:hypothetical protein
MTPSRPKRTRHRQHARVQADRANALPPETLARLEEALGYRFREAQLALTALTHASLGERWGVAATNERLTSRTANRRTAAGLADLPWPPTSG